MTDPKTSPRPKRKNIMEVRLTTAHMFISNALGDQKIQSALAKYGYTAERLQEGLQVVSTALALYQQQQIAYGNLATAKAMLATTQARARSLYVHDIKVARLALENDQGALRKLGLITERKHGQVARLMQIQQFYTNALSDTAILVQLAGYGVTQARLETGQSHINAVAACYAARLSQQSDARASTMTRDEAFAAMDAWMSNFRQIARIALKSQPRDLEKIGVVARA